MSLIDFLKEEREVKKQRKKLQKEQKKQKLTKEQKKYKIFGIITGCLITFGAIFSCCSSFGGVDYSWNNIVGITDEMIVALEETVDESSIVPNGIIEIDDWNSCNTKLLDMGIDIESEMSNEFDVKDDFYLTDRELAAMAKKSLETISTSGNARVLDFEIYAIGDVFYERSVIYINLSNVVLNATLPSVYVTSISRIEVLSNSVTCMDYDVKINNIEEELNNEILEVLKKNSTTNIESIGNSIVNTTISAFASAVGADIILHHGQICFNV